MGATASSSAPAGLVSSATGFNFNNENDWVVLCIDGRLDELRALRDLAIERAYPFDVNVKLPDGDFALLLAASHGHCALVEWLVEDADADVDQTDANGTTALASAVKFGRNDVVHFLCFGGVADTNIQDAGGMTALMFAAQFGDATMIDDLIAALADVDLLDAQWNTSLHYALMQSPTITTSLSARELIVSKLIARGADTSVRNKHGDTVWSLARAIGDDMTENITAAIRRRQRERASAIRQILDEIIGDRRAEQDDDDDDDDDELLDDENDEDIERLAQVITEYDAHQTIPSIVTLSRRSSLSRRSTTSPSESPVAAATPLSPTNDGVVVTANYHRRIPSHNKQRLSLTERHHSMQKHGRHYSVGNPIDIEAQIQSPSNTQSTISQQQQDEHTGVELQSIHIQPSP